MGDQALSGSPVMVLLKDSAYRVETFSLNLLEKAKCSETSGTVSHLDKQRYRQTRLIYVSYSLWCNLFLFVGVIVFLLLNSRVHIKRWGSGRWLSRILGWFSSKKVKNYETHYHQVKITL